MFNLAATAERLRVVRAACLDFITLWAVDRMMSDARSSDRLWGDVLKSHRDGDSRSGSFSKFGRGLDD